MGLLALLLTLLSSSVTASPLAVMEQTKTSHNTIFVDTTNARLDVSTQSYNGNAVNVGLYSSSNVVVSNTSSDNCVIYATGTLACQTIVAGTINGSSNYWSRNVSAGTLIPGTATDKVGIGTGGQSNPAKYQFVAEDNNTGDAAAMIGGGNQYSIQIGGIGTPNYSGSIYFINDTGTGQAATRVHGSYQGGGTSGKSNLMIDRATNSEGYGADASTLTYTNEIVIDGSNGNFGLGTGAQVGTPPYLFVAEDNNTGDSAAMIGGGSQYSIQLGGIGTPNYAGAVYFLNDNGSAQTATRIHGSYLGGGTSGNPNLMIDRATNSSAYGNDAAKLTYTNEVTIDGSNGNFGIGTTSPGAKLEVSGGAVLFDQPMISSVAVSGTGVGTSGFVCQATVPWSSYGHMDVVVFSGDVANTGGSSSQFKMYILVDGKLVSGETTSVFGWECSGLSLNTEENCPGSLSINPGAGAHKACIGFINSSGTNGYATDTVNELRVITYP